MAEDYISRQAAIDAVTDELDMIDHVPQWVFDRLEKRLKQLPSADVVPMVHSRWVLGGYDDMYYVCEKCRHKQSEYYAKPTANFCPNCGAKIDKED